MYSPRGARPDPQERACVRVCVCARTEAHGGTLGVWAGVGRLAPRARSGGAKRALQQRSAVTLGRGDVKVRPLQRLKPQLGSIEAVSAEADTHEHVFTHTRPDRQEIIKIPRFPLSNFVWEISQCVDTC